jgi:hypothetical protein
MLDEFAVRSIVVREIRQIRGKTHGCHEVLEIAGQARVDRITLHIDESRVRKYGMY